MALETKTLDDQPMLEESASVVRWGAIFCGALMVIAVATLFTLLGAGIGLSSFSLEAGETPEKGAAIGAGFYAFVAMVVSFFIGGYVASRLAGFKFRGPAVLHGLSVWALIVGLFTFLVGSGVSGILGGTFNLAGGALSAAGTSGQSILQSSSVKQTPSGDIKVKVGEKSAKVDQGKVQAQAKEAAGTARRVTAASSWVAFFSFLIGAIASALGGLVGNPDGRIGARRHTRTVDRRAA